MAVDTTDDTVACVRRFTRYYTSRIGVLQEALLGSAFSLPEGRLIYEMALKVRTTASDLVAELNLDPGYVSRLLKGLEARGFVARASSEMDGRQSILSLTVKGRAEFEKINHRSDLEIRKLLEPLGAYDRQELRHSLAKVERLLGGAIVKSNCSLRGLQPGDMGWIVHRQAILYAREFGWDNSYEALIAKVGAEFIESYDARRDAAWIAVVDDRIVGSVFLVRKTKTVAKLRLLYVEPEVRGHGIGRRLVETCMSHARELGYARLTLWTNDVLTAARAIYERAGFELVKSEPHLSFGKNLIGETWERDL